MHNSQNATTQVFAGAGAGWTTGANPALTGGGNADQSQLLKTDCVGCHSATTNAKTIITDAGGNKIPIVYNMGGYPTGIPGAADHPLAGGNFASNALSANVYGHNVYGISNVDTTITNANGNPGGIGCANSCHTSLALADSATATFNYNLAPQGNFNGCKGCHNKVGHHNANDPSYRYLGGHGTGVMAVGYVKGGTGTGVPNNYEDTDWEQSVSDVDHNFYKKQSNLATKDSIGTFCAGCHGAFHAPGADASAFVGGGTDNGGDDNTDNKIVANSAVINPWLRHPTNVNIPLGLGASLSGEYDALLNAAYNPVIPVAQDDAVWANKDTIQQGDQVMCLSCHRAHASQYPDALRFDYSLMNAHANTGAGTGCFYCHTTKDNP
jgi:predicted CXXCH cytochrome family protein